MSTEGLSNLTQEPSPVGDNFIMWMGGKPGYRVGVWGSRHLWIAASPPNVDGCCRVSFIRAYFPWSLLEPSEGCCPALQGVEGKQGGQM